MKIRVNDTEYGAGTVRYSSYIYGPKRLGDDYIEEHAFACMLEDVIRIVELAEEATTGQLVTIFDAIHGICHAAKTEGILPLRTV